jgi:hypothetical protein
MSVTLDGFMEGPKRELSDTAEFVDPDFDRYASEMLELVALDGNLHADNQKRVEEQRKVYGG